MIQDIYPMNYDNSYHNFKVKDDDYILVYENGTAVFKNEKYDFFKYSDISSRVNKECYYVYLFSIDNKRFFLLRGPFDMSDYSERIRPLDFRELDPQWRGFAGICGANLAKWYNENRYCGTCGTRTAHSRTERALVCPNCKRIIYPVIAPAVIAAVTNGDKILLTKYAGREYKKYTLVAGYTEIGETLEQTVRREICEEVGLNVKNIRYFASQPWPFSGTELMGFTAELDGDDAVIIDKSELSTAKWFKRDEIEIDNNTKSLTNTMILAFKKGEF